MEQKEIIIKIQNDRVLFNPQLSIDIRQTSIPFEHLKFRTNEDIYWKVEMLEYEPLEKCLKVKILNYKATDISTFTNQPAKREIKKLIFVGKYDWARLDPLLASYVRSRFINELENINDKQSSFIERTKQTSFTTNTKAQQFDLSKPIKPFVRIITEDFWIAFNDAQFMLGNVSFQKHIKKIDRNIDFKISNDHILAEFDNIKYWFSKKLKTKKFHVTANITLIDNEVNQVNATSKEIDLITPELIDSINYLRTLELTKVPKESDVDKSLFTAEDIFSQVDTDDIEGNVFKQSEQDILNFLTEKGNVRNKKELAYLSGHKQTENHSIRYTLHPNFGFLFLIEGVENNHFVWELLNSHATYIWTIGKFEREINLQFKRIESTVNLIRTMRRDEYKRAFKSGNIDSDLVFKVIKHKDIGSNFIDEFPKWKDKLNEQLI